MTSSNSEARKKTEAQRVSVAGDWSMIVLLDGEAVTGAVPCTDWDAAQVMSPLVASWLGGPVSVANAVAATRHRPEDQPSLFEEPAA